MNRILMGAVTVGLLVIAAGCGSSDSLTNFRSGVPDDGSVTITAPQKANAVIGQTAEWYTTTFVATTTVNISVVAVLDILHAIVANPPSSHPSSNVYVWGPGNGSPLDPLVYQLTVTDNGNSNYSYNFDAKGKNDPDTAFVTILSGTHTPVVTNGVNDDKHGNGSFLLDWDKRATLANPPTDLAGHKLQGTAEVTYDHRTADEAVDVAFTNIVNDQGQTASATYHFKQASGADGLFQFSTNADVNGNGTLEFVTIESRWHQDGSGRADIAVTQGDVPAGQTGQASQCWDTSFLSQYEIYAVPLTAGGTYSSNAGDVTQCAFATAEYFNG